jgi:transcriptional regulator with XRE-family HTH domain
MKKNRTLVLLGLNIRRIREENNLTQEALSERCDLDSTYISGIERGVRNPSIISLMRLTVALETTVSAICEGIEKKV